MISRYVAFVLILAMVFGLMYVRMYDMQVTAHDAYTADAEEKRTKTITLTGMRGTIYDANMIPLAYDRLTYNVQFYRDPSATSSSARAEYTRSIIKVIELVESNGKSTIGGFWLERGEDGQWRFNTGTENADVAARRIKQWRGNFYLEDVEVKDLFDTLCANYAIPDDLSEEMKLKVLSVWQESRMYNYLSKPVTIAYSVDFETVSEIEVRSMDLLGISIAESSERVYPKGSLAAHTVGYISKISGEETLAAYKEKGYANDAKVGMTGIEASMEDQLTPFIAYRQGEQVVEINNRGKVIRELSYAAPVDGNDIILTIDTQLQAVMEEALERNIRGINSVQQKLVETWDWRKANRDELHSYMAAGKDIQMAKTGAAVAMDPNTGRVLAMASYPSYDLSMFSDGIDMTEWNELIKDERNPMLNRAIATRDTPGSIFKLVTALGALMEGVLTLDERIDDQSPYQGTDLSYQPSCWIGARNASKHSNQTVVEGIKNSCNYFFFEVGNRLGTVNITKWAATLGLTSRTGIELPNEATSFVGNQLMLYDSSRAITDQYTSKPEFTAWVIKNDLRDVGMDRGIEYDEDRLDRVAKKLLDLVDMEGTKDAWIPEIRNILLNDMNIPSDYIAQHFMVNNIYRYISDLRWTPNETIMAAIGQSITQVTPVAVARYASAVANGGTVYDAQIIDKIVSPAGEVLLEKEPVVVTKIEGADEYLKAIRKGMEEVTSVENDGTAAGQFQNAKYDIAAKTGTGQRTNLDVENNSWLLTYAPIEDPQIVVVVYIQNGYAGARSAGTAIATIEYYLDSLKKAETTTVAAPNSLAE